MPVRATWEVRIAYPTCPIEKHKIEADGLHDAKSKAETLSSRDVGEWVVTRHDLIRTVHLAPLDWNDGGGQIELEYLEAVEGALEEWLGW